MEWNVANPQCELIIFMEQNITILAVILILSHKGTTQH